MTHLLPPNLLRLFAPRPPLDYMRPPGRDPDKPIIKQKITGVASLLEQLKQQEAENPEGSLDNTPATDTEYLKYLKRKEEREKQKKEQAARQKETYDPTKDPSAVGDPYKTLFISKLSKEATEEDLRREFAMYGHIENLRIVRDANTGKSKGYAFILYEREKDMKAAYKDAEGIKILDKRILVDVERGRTVKDWKPMRLGGGLGGRPKPVQPQEASFFGGPGGFRGGFRGRGNMRANDRVGGGGGFRGGRGGRGGRGAFGDRPPSDRPPYGGGGGGYGDRGGGGYSDRGGDRGGFSDRGGGDFQDRGPPRGGYGGRGRGIGYGGGAFGQDAGSFGQKRDFDSASGYQRGGFQSGGGGPTDAGWGDRDSKRSRY